MNLTIQNGVGSCYAHVPPGVHSMAPVALAVSVSFMSTGVANCWHDRGEICAGKVCDLQTLFQSTCCNRFGFVCTENLGVTTFSFKGLSVFSMQ